MQPPGTALLFHRRNVAIVAGVRNVETLLDGKDGRAAGSREQVLKARHVAKTTRRRSILGETKSASDKPPGKGAASW